MLQLLMQTMENLTKAHEQLLQMAHKKQELLMERKVQALSDLVQAESQLVKQIGKLEQERMFQVEQYMQQQGLSSAEVTMAQVVETIQVPQVKERLLDFTQKLQQMIGELKNQNELNMRLTQDSLDYVNHSIELLADVKREQMNYTHVAGQQAGASQVKKDSPPTQGQSFFDTKA